MMTRFLAGLALVSVSVAASAQTRSVAQPFNVTTTFASACTTSGSVSDLSFGNYTAFGTAAEPAPTTTVSFQCSRALAIVNAVFDTSGDVASSSAAGTTPSGGGVIAGLRYTLAASAPTKTTTGTAATASAAGTADVWAYTITGAMAGGQAGCVESGNAGDRCSATQARTLTITY